VQLSSQTVTSFEVIRLPQADAIASARGRYLCTLHVGDTVPTTWLATFAELDQLHADMVLFHPVVRDGERIASFDLVRHALEGGMPACSLALPLSQLQQLGRLPDPDLGPLDWPVLAAELAELMGVVDAMRLLPMQPEPVVGRSGAASDDLAARLGARPILLGTGWHHVAGARAEAARRAIVEATSAAAEASRLTDEVQALRRELAHYDAMVQEAVRAKQSIERSFWWRLTSPGRWLAAKVRSVRM
jgi:hypothetical protein